MSWTESSQFAPVAGSAAPVRDHLPEVDGAGFMVTDVTARQTGAPMSAVLNN
jgi:hypothetical protein